ncbi:MAG: hypothetical protein SOY07_09020 [Bacteroidales bacterium]|nr:hypothetical protein [Bacteroidales bacterium]
MTPEQTKIVKVVAYSAAGIAAFVIGKKIIGAIVSSIQSSSNLRNLRKQIDTIGSLATINQTQATKLADSLFQAMKDTGTDTNAVTIVLQQVRNEYDWLLIRTAFGTPEYGTVGEPWWGSGTPTDLIGWCRKELSGSLLTTCNTWESKANALGLGGLSDFSIVKG